ncbi:MAG: M14 family metallopeptidase [Lentimicrobiaceae bacterium]|nr:M14 family metallopeptidase [Lentimicrobiaceae bacterium]
MLRYSLAFLIILFILPVAEAQDYLTFYEKSGYKKTPTYSQTMDYCRLLASTSSKIHITGLGKSAQGREIDMLIIDRDGLQTPEAIRASGRVITLIQACIHPGESEGKDATLMLLRDMMVRNEHKNLLDKTSIIFIPIFNVDGHERSGPYNRINQNGPEEMGWRTNAQNLNLNRDFMKADTPEMQHWLAMFHQWMPDFFMDIHTTDGADYQYAVTYAIETYGNLDSGLTRWLKNIYEPRMSKKMEEAGFPVFPYVQFRQWHDPRSGLRNGPSPAMISQGYVAAANRAGVLVETHMLKDYQTRVQGAYQMIVETLAIVNHQAETLKTLNQMADKSTVAPEFRKQDMILSWETDKTDSTMVTFAGFDYEIRKSELTGGNWYVYDNTKPVEFTLPLFDKAKPKNVVKLPAAYIIPAEWNAVIQRLKFHDVYMERLIGDDTIKVESYVFHDPDFRCTPNEGRHMVNARAEGILEIRPYIAGSVVVPVNQRNAKIIALLLEPMASGSLLEWGFFNAIFEQKEYAETYVMEKMAREMLEKDEQLQRAFENKKREDPQFSKSQWEMLNWFYHQSLYQDEKFMKYPVGRIVDAASLNQIRKNTTSMN